MTVYKFFLLGKTEIYLHLYPWTCIRAHARTSVKTPTWLQKIGSKEMETSRFPEIQGNSRPLCESYMCINKKVCIIILYKYYMPCHHKITLNSSKKNNRNNRAGAEITDRSWSEQGNFVYWIYVTRRITVTVGSSMYSQRLLVTML